jgi:hypothetical protein
MDYQKENLTRPDFFNELQKYSQSLIEEIIAKFRDENEKRFDDVNEYVHKLKLSLNQEFKKLNEENISLIKDKYILDLDKEINLLFQDKDKLLKENHINFISNLLQIKYKLDASIPDFHLKDQISYDKIIDSIKKYIEEYFVKPRNSIDQQIQNLKLENQFLDEKYKNLSEEYKKDKTEFKQTVNNYNDMLIENKLKLKTSEEKIKNFESEKKTIKETNERAIKASNKEFEEKIEKMKMEINKINSEKKAKEDELLVNKLNDEKVSALNVQKITFLEKELEQWKERYNLQGKELLENKNNIINLNSEMDKLKTENRNLKAKLGVGAAGLVEGADKKMENLRGSAINFFPNNTTNAVGSNILGSSKLLVELLNGQSAIKDFLKELMNKTDDLVNKNKQLINNNKKLTSSLNGNSHNSSANTTYNSSSNSLSNINNNINTYNESKDNKYELKNSTNISNILNSNNAQNKNNINRNNSFSKVTENKEDKFKDPKIINSNFNTIDAHIKKDLDIKVINSVLKKDITGKPFLDYICEVKNGNQSYKLNKKFGHFMMLHKALKSIFKDNLKLPNGGNLFININEMKQNAFHENKLEQLDKYISDLLNLEGVITSLPFRNFFELDEAHEQKLSDNNSGKYRTSLEKKK